MNKEDLLELGLDTYTKNKVSTGFDQHAFYEALNVISDLDSEKNGMNGFGKGDLDTDLYLYIDKQKAKGGRSRRRRKNRRRRTRSRR